MIIIEKATKLVAANEPSFCGCFLLNRNTTGDHMKKVCQRYLFENLVMPTLESTLDKNAILAQIEAERSV